MLIYNGTPGDDETTQTIPFGTTYWIYMFAGNDIIHFYGIGGILGYGDYFLYGGVGNDTYDTANPVSDNFDMGNVVIFDEGGVADKLSIDADGAGWTFSLSGDDLVIKFMGYTGEITIQDMFAPGLAHAIETFEWNDQTRNLVEGLTAENDVYSATANTSPLGIINNVVNGFGGNDTIFLGQGNDTGYGGEGDDTVRGNIGDDSLYGGLGNDMLYGDAGDDIVHGNQGDDVIYGGHGADMLYGDSGIDTIYGDAGADSIYGGADADTIYGGTANDFLYGEAGSDTLFGDANNDLLSGGSGLDTMTGGSGRDTFVLEGESAFFNRDVVTDYVNGKSGDRIDISDILSDYGYETGTDALADWVSTTFSGADTILRVDRDGEDSAFGMSQVLLIQNQNLTLADLTVHENLITETLLA